MRVSVCVGEYAQIPYCVPGLEMNVYSMEELSYCIKENAFLLDTALMEDRLLEWIDKQCGLQDLAKALYPLVHKRGSLSSFVVMILGYVGFYGEEDIRQVELVLKQGAGLSRVEKRKSQIDHLVKKKKYVAAIREYDDLIRKWQELEKEGEPLPAVSCLASIRHNKGVAYAGMMHYGKAAECFREAYDTDGGGEEYLAYLAAKRMELSEEDYIALVAGETQIQGTLELEKEMDRLVNLWEQQPAYLRLCNRRRMRVENRQAYQADTERLTQALKENYRSLSRIKAESGSRGSLAFRKTGHDGKCESKRTIID